MATLTLAPKDTWFNTTKATRANIIQIDILNSYTPAGNEITWDASEDKDGSINCYVIDTHLIIAGNGSGKIYANADSSYLFSALKVNGVRLPFTNLTTINGLELLDTQNATTFLCMFYLATSLKKVTGLRNWNTSKVETMRAVFLECYALESIEGLEGWDTSNVTTLKQMFNKCVSLLDLTGIKNWNTGNVTDISSFLCGNDNAGDMLLPSIDLNNWDTHSLITADFAFYGCGQFKELDLNNWDMSQVKDINHIFADCFLLEKINVSNWDLSNCESFSAAFNDCRSLTIIDVSGWNTISAKEFQQLFEYCHKLKKIIGLENFNTTSLNKNIPISVGDFAGKIVSEFNEMFSNCHALTEINLSSFDTRNCGYFDKMFIGCENLKTIYVGDLWSTESAESDRSTDMFYDCKKLEGEDGTTFSTENVSNINYAKVDGENNTPGYFSHINNKAKEVLVNAKSLYRAAKALRHKLGNDVKLKPNEFENAIKSIGV